MPTDQLQVLLAIAVATAAVFITLHYRDRAITPGSDGHTAPPRPYTSAEAHRVWRTHMGCDTRECGARRAAIATLVADGKVTLARWSA